MFNAYYIIKYLHIISSILMVGTGFGSAIYVFLSNRYGNLQTQYFTNRMVVLLDWIITTPTVIIQPATGFILAYYYLDMEIFSEWLINVYLFYILVGAAWLPVVWLQIKMKQLTDNAVHNNKPLNPIYKRYQKYWETLGYIGFSGSLVLFFLMVTKMPLISF